MDFFDWVNFPQIIYELSFESIPDTAEAYVAQMLRSMYICLAVGGGLYLIALILGGIGLSTMAKKTGLGHRYLAFLPFANTWYAGKLAGEASFFGQKMKRAGLYAMLLEIVYCILQIILIMIGFALTKADYYVLQTLEGGGMGWQRNPSLIPNGSQWMYTVSCYSWFISYLLWFLVIVFMCVVFTALFRKYYARSPILMTFLCTLLPFRGFTLFAVRNNTPVNYNEYIRRRTEEYARRNNPYGGSYGGGYNGGYNGGSNGGYNGGGSAQQQPPQGNAPDPFSEFGESNDHAQNDDPFGDFH